MSHGIRACGAARHGSVVQARQAELAGQAGLADPARSSSAPHITCQSVKPPHVRAALSLLSSHGHERTHTQPLATPGPSRRPTPNRIANDTLIHNASCPYCMPMEAVPGVVAWRGVAPSRSADTESSAGPGSARLHSSQVHYSKRQEGLPIPNLSHGYQSRCVAKGGNQKDSKGPAEGTSQMQLIAH